MTSTMRTLVRGRLRLFEPPGPVDGNDNTVTRIGVPGVPGTAATGSNDENPDATPSPQPTATSMGRTV